MVLTTRIHGLEEYLEHQLNKKLSELNGGNRYPSDKTQTVYVVCCRDNCYTVDVEVFYSKKEAEKRAKFQTETHSTLGGEKYFVTECEVK